MREHAYLYQRRMKLKIMGHITCLLPENAAAVGLGQIRVNRWWSFSMSSLCLSKFGIYHLITLTSIVSKLSSTRRVCLGLLYVLFLLGYFHLQQWQQNSLTQEAWARKGIVLYNLWQNLWHFLFSVYWQWWDFCYSSTRRCPEKTLGHFMCFLAWSG